MKNNIKQTISTILLAAMLTTGLTACGTGEPATDTASANPSDATQTTTDSAAEAAETEPEPDYSDFVFPEETDTLVVYSSGMLTQTLNPAIKIFEEMYPHINVDYRVLGEDEHQTLIQTEIPAGAGPDLMFSYGVDLPDIYKTMATGVFCDLNPYFHNDEEFSFDDYITGALTGGQMQKKQYIMPIQFNMPIVMTTLGILEENGIAPESLDTYEGFLDAAATFKQNNPDSGLLSYGADEAYLSDLYELCGLSFIDYVSNTITMDNDILQKFADVCKLYYNPKAADPLAGDTINSLAERKYMFELCNVTNSWLQVYDSAVVAYKLEEPTYLTLVPDPYGGSSAYLMTFAAIPNGSQNKLNAYRLLKILLSDEIQYGSNATLGMPVRRESFRKNYTASIEEVKGYGFEVDEESFNSLIERCFSVTRTFASPSILRRYLKLEITPYLQGKRSFADCYDNLYTTIELYKDE
ncbi:MAG: extracellular solute-binding protein [Clostridia bacterium]|nr:extracellular solute-binding protein [Clostridia bacterium]